MTIEFVIKSANPSYSANKNDKNKVDSNKDVQEIFLYKIIDYEAIANSTSQPQQPTYPPQPSSLPNSNTLLSPRKNRKKRILVGSDLQEKTLFLDTKNTHYNDEIQKKVEASFDQLHLFDNEFSTTINNRKMSLLPSSEECKYKQYRLHEIEKTNKDIEKMKTRGGTIDINL